MSVRPPLLSSFPATTHSRPGGRGATCCWCWRAWHLRRGRKYASVRARVERWAVGVNRKSVTFPKVFQKRGGRKQETWQPGGLRWSQQWRLVRLMPVEAGDVGKRDRGSVRATMGPPLASGRTTCSPTPTWVEPPGVLWAAVTGGLGCCGATFLAGPSMEGVPRSV